ncbi:MAG: hypothetical protein VR64_23460 [Desulfatitalea sp. BRH_c12]|nr:MAG: hypothetical protein VR64_23460 [Desulfatitalea sp. BRH_c12]
MLNAYNKWMLAYGSGWDSVVHKHYHSLLKTQFAAHATIQEQKLDKIKNLLRHAYESTVFYKERLNQTGIKPRDIKSLDDLKKIPPLTREDLNSQLQALISDRYSKDQIHYDKTGGSTGLSTQFVRSNECLAIKKATEFRFNSWAGWKPGERILYYWSPIQDFSSNNKKPNEIIQKYFRKRLALYAGKLNPEILAQHAEKWKKFQPHLVRAFPSSLQMFAEYLNENNISPYSPKAIITVGETLNQFQRALFEKTFRCKVFNCYVSRECGNMASECNEHDGLHVAEELIHIEVETENDDVGNLLITDLSNFAMPLIRYRIQDMSKIKLGKCSCGRTLIKLNLESARLSDYIVSPVDNTKIGGVTIIHYLLAEGPRVGRFQIIQDKKNHLLIKMSGSKSDNQKGIAHIHRTIDTLFEGKMLTDIEFVEHIPFLKSGKYQFIRREIP